MGSNTSPLPERYRKRPVVVEALQLRWDNWGAMCAFAGVGKLIDGKPEGCYLDEKGFPTARPNQLGLSIPTLEGVMLAREGDWIIKGAKGELYPVKPDIFLDSYVLVDETKLAEPATETAAQRSYDPSLDG